MSDNETNIRILALDRALEAWSAHHTFPGIGQQDNRTPRILDTAKEFEAYLRGEEEIETPEQSAAIVAANLGRMGVSLGGPE